MTIAIIGGGVAGLSLGWQLARRGAEVTILEANTIASGASGVATAYLEPRLGGGRLRQLEWESIRCWPDFVAGLEALSGHSVDFRTDGQLRIVWPEDETRIRGDFETRLTQGWEVEWLDGDAVRLLEPGLSSEIIGATRASQVHWLDGAKLCTALTAAIEKTDGTIREHCAARAIIASDGRITGLETNLGNIAADQAVICNGMGVNDLAGLPDDIPQSRPAKGTTLFYRTATPLLTRMIRHPGISLCPRADGIIAGSSRERGETSLKPDPAIVTELYARAVRVLPALAGLPPPEPRCGLRALVDDGLLRLGQSSQVRGLYYSLSQAGAGFLRAPVISKELAAYVLNNDAECKFISPFLKDAALF